MTQVNQNIFSDGLIEIYRNLMFPALSIRELARTKATCKLFFDWIKDNPTLNDKLDFPKNLHTWAKENEGWMLSKTLYINLSFLSKRDIALRDQCDCKKPHRFSLKTMLDVANAFRKEQELISSCSISVHQPRELSPEKYIHGIAKASTVYYHLWKIQGAPLDTCHQHGQKAFYNEDGYSSTSIQKAEACERFVVEIFLKMFPKGIQGGR